MKPIILSVLFLLSIISFSFCQVSSNQEWSKERSEYLAKEEIVFNYLKPTDFELYELRVDAITAASSGELSVVVYECVKQNKKGVLIGFWNSGANEFGIIKKYYAFKHFDFEEAGKFLGFLIDVMNTKYLVWNNRLRPSNINPFFKYGDLTFVFYLDNLSNKVRVFWEGRDSEWNQANIKTTIRRYENFFGVKFKSQE